MHSASRQLIKIRNAPIYCKVDQKKPASPQLQVPDPGEGQAARIMAATPAILQAVTSSLRCFLELRDTVAEADIHAISQQIKLHLWMPQKDQGPDCVNKAVARLPINSSLRHNVMTRMQQVFLATRPHPDGILHPPRVIVVPLGLHSLNPVRILALVEALELLVARFGEEVLNRIDIYFVGGRDLVPQEMLPVRDVMAQGFALYCKADWQQLTAEQQNALLDDFCHELQQGLGDSELRLAAPMGDQKPGEADSARHIWAQAPHLQRWRAAFGDRAHFVEASRSQYRRADRDNTHGNALQVLAECFTSRLLGQGQGQVMVCSDSFSGPRAALIFEGYCRAFDIPVSVLSRPLTGHDLSRQRQMMLCMLPLFVRELACLQHEIVQSGKADSATPWYDVQPLHDKLPG